MAFKAIIDLDVNDRNFQDFMEKFEKFSQLEKDIPKPVEKMDRKIKDSGRSLEVFSGGLGKSMRSGFHASKSLTVMMDHAVKGALTFSSRIKSGTKDLEKMGHVGGRTFAIIGNIMKSAGSALPFIGGALVGVSLGALALYRHQSRTILDRYKSAKAMGVTPGEQAALETSYSPVLLNPVQTFAQMRDQYTSPSGKAYLERTIGPDYRSMGNMEAYATLIRNAKNVANTTPTSELEIADITQGFSNVGISTADLRLLKNTSWATINAAIEDAKKQASVLQFSRATGRRMSEIAVTIAQKEMQISTDLSRTLAKGAPTVNTALNNLADVIQGGADRLNRLLGGKSASNSKPNSTSAPWYKRINNPMDIEAYKGDASYMNPNGIRYAEFNSDAQAYRKAGELVSGYGLNTLKAIMSKYEGSPLSASRLEAGEKASGFGANQYINLKDPDNLAKVVTALRVTEQPHQRSDAQLYQVIKRAIVDGMRASIGQVSPSHNLAAQIHMASQG